MIIKAISLITILLLSGFVIQDSVAEKKYKSSFTGNLDMNLYGPFRVDFKIYESYDDLISSKLKAKLGDKEINMVGGGFMQTKYKFNDRQCKSINGWQTMLSTQEDRFKMMFNGKICHMGTGLKLVSATFQAVEKRGIFENADFTGSMSGKSNLLENIFNSTIKSTLVFNS